VVSSLFIVGGARSGKSRFAVERVPTRQRIVFVATAEARDEDMAKRIARHRAARPSHWATVEEPLDLVPRLEKLEGTCDGIIVDCLTLWVANRLLRGDRDDAILDVQGARAARMRVVQVTSSRRMFGADRPDLTISRLAELPEAIERLDA